MSHRRHHRAKPKPGVADNARRFHEIVAQLAEQSGRAKDDLLVVEGAWVQLSMENTRAAILEGRVVEIAALERLAAILTNLIPPKPFSLDVRFIDHSDLCVKCRAELPPREERAPRPAPTPAPAKAAAPPPSPSPDKAASAKLAPAPKLKSADVVPITTPDDWRYGALYVGGALERNPAHGLPMDSRDSRDQRR
jgi:hypothetical protein